MFIFYIYSLYYLHHYCHLFLNRFFGQDYFHNLASIHSQRTIAAIVRFYNECNILASFILKNLLVQSVFALNYFYNAFIYFVIASFYISATKLYWIFPRSQNGHIISLSLNKHNTLISELISRLYCIKKM